MKKLAQQPQDVFYLANNRVMVPVKEPYKIQEQMIEMKNFVPEAFIIHQFQEYPDLELECYDYIRVSKADTLASSQKSQSDPERILPVNEDGGEDDDDWDDEDEDWDEDDEDWDDDDEDDEDWDDDDDEWDDDDEDWEEDGDEGEAE